MKKHLLKFLTIGLLFLSISGNAQIPSYIPKDSLVGWWPFNGNANDESGNGNHGIVSGTTLSKDRKGVSNKSYSFNGSGNYITISKSGLARIQQNITISVWIYMDGGSCNPRILECNGFTLITNGTSNTSRTVDGFFGNGSNRVGGTSSKSLNSLSWHHLVFVGNGSSGTSQFYFDGASQGNLTSSTSLFNKINYTTDLTIGNIDPYRCDWWGGNIDDLVIWNRALDSNEIKVLYFGCKPKNHKKLTTSDTITACSSLKLTSKNKNYQSYKWSNGDTTLSTKITKSGLITILETDTSGCSNIDKVYIRLISKTVDTTIYNSKLGDTLKISPNKWFKSTTYDFYNSQKSKVDSLKIIYNGKDSILWKGYASLKTNTNLKCQIVGKIQFLKYASFTSKWINVAPNNDHFVKLIKISNTHYLATAGDINSGYATNPMYIGAGLTNWKSNAQSFASHMGHSFKKSNSGQIFLSTGHAGVYNSLDSGKTWNYTVGSGYGCMATSLEFDSANNIYLGIAGYLRGLHVSHDSGKTFSNKISGMDFTQIKFTGYNGGFNRVIGIANQNVYLSKDNGTNWSQITGTNFANDAVMVTSYKENIFIIKGNGEIYQSIDGCSTWTKYSRIPVDSTKASAYLGNTVMYGKGQYYFGLLNQGIWGTLDDGKNWKRIDTIGGLNTTISDFQLLNDTFVILGSGGILLMPINYLFPNECKPKKYVKLTTADTLFACTSLKLTSKNKNYKSYKWSNGDTTITSTITKSGLVTILETDTNGCKNIDTVYVRILKDEISVAPDTSICNVKANDTLKINLVKWFGKTEFDYFNSSKNKVQTADIFIKNSSTKIWKGSAALKNNNVLKCPISGKVYPSVVYPRLVHKLTDTVLTTTTFLKPALVDKKYTKYRWSNGDSIFTTKYINSGNYWFQQTDSVGCSQTDSFHFSRINLTIPSRITAKLGVKMMLKVKDSTNATSSVVWSNGDTGWSTGYIVTKNVDTLYATQTDAYRSVIKFIVITKTSPKSLAQNQDYNLEYDTTNQDNDIPQKQTIETSKIRIYPNPVGSTITLEGLTSTHLKYEIYSVSGKLVQVGNASPKINVENLPTGLYLLKLENVAVKFVKE